MPSDRDGVSDRERHLEARLAAIETLLIRVLARNPDYFSELLQPSIPPQSRIGESSFQFVLAKLSQDFDKLTRSLIEERERTDFRITELEGVRQRERTYVQMLALISEQDTFSQVPMNRVLPMSIYLKEGDYRYLIQEHELLSAIGFTVFFQEEVEYGSLFDRLFGRSDDPITRDEVYERLSKIERALELKGIEVPQSEADLNRANAAKALLEAFENEEEAAALVGSLCVLKKDKKVAVLSLSQEQLLAIRKNPELAKNPAGLQELLFRRTTDAANPDAISAIENQSESTHAERNKDRKT